ncbi:MAG: cupin domain-containing protein [Planctomycetota bacterium]
MAKRARVLIPFLAGCAACLAVLLLIQSPGDATPSDAPSLQRKAASPVVQSFDKAEEVKFSWGWIRWLMSSKIDPKAQMTFGIVHVSASVRNPVHVHPNCEECLHVLSGSCRHLVGTEWVTLKAGDTVRIPAGVPHVAETLDEPMRAVIVYSSGERQFVLVEEGEKE